MEKCCNTCKTKYYPWMEYMTFFIDSVAEKATDAPKTGHEKSGCEHSHLLLALTFNNLVRVTKKCIFSQ